ncbi:hypothetical protein ABZT06_50215 [Streptomyces sp. NPDC005483]|uniref:hypothetical protein n=1 Tax=Streptomyces sp. NPDC005483 TaxID=3154882 RepID=UPI0033A6265D
MTSLLADGRLACGCGEDQIPWMLAKFGFLGLAGLVLAVLVVMTLAGWLMASAVSLVMRWRHPPVTVEETPPGSLDGFTWRTDEPRYGAVRDRRDP